MKTLHLLLGCAAALALTAPAAAHENDSRGIHAMDHAPIGVMGDHRHKTGEWMVSYRYMTMDMDGNRDGTNSLSPDTIATTVANPFFGIAGQPPTLRVVPLDMKMDMHMAGAMYGLSDKITLMAMTNYLSNSMNHLTYMGGMGTMVRGGFQTESKGFGDSTIGLIYGLDDGSKKGHQINIGLGLSLPTGSNEKTDQILTPLGMTPTPRLPYPMQLGTGTYDVKPSLTYFDRAGKLGWGAQASARIPFGDNDKGYKLGTRAEATAWMAYEPAYWLSFSGRIKAKTQGQIDGQDPVIIAPVQTADPQNSGGDQIEIGFGVNLAGQSGALRGHRLALEYSLPVYRNLGGPQLETDSTVTIGWQKAF